MKAILLALLLLIPVLAGSPARAVMKGHCATFRVTPIAGEPGAFKVETARGSIVARRPAPVPHTFETTAFAQFRVYPFSYDADGDTLGTLHDTIVVAPGTLVRWVRSGPGFHTV